MAPFVLDGSLLYAKSVIKGLGDFSLIRSPAKCAARIGQAFSQTLNSVSVPPSALLQIPDVERNGHTFSDGVGTCSQVILNKIWEGYSAGRALKPTIFQIRFQGAKGVISLDTRLQGEALCLRPSMIKFKGSTATNLEICDAANKPLPLYLNRQLIKILEDLGVAEKPLLDLQAAAVERLRMTTLSPINASSFLQRNLIGKTASLPWLIRKLSAIGLQFNDDDFLRNTLELAVLVQLREIKHRSRILVENGTTVYGIMDETGILGEGEIYCSVHTDRGPLLLKGSVVITRCPALHPGDVQCVTAVDVPVDSPLRALHNMVAFSSKGARDLPSQLSGGDLDGDIYNIIYDSGLYPQHVVDPANYDAPKAIDIGRPVERGDITDFFITFMENDNLGMIATLHQILADQRPCGTLDPECIRVASLHSTAVDYSKTGIPRIIDFPKVSISDLPKFPKARPDFQAPGPQVLIAKDIALEADEAMPSPVGDDELEEAAAFGPPQHPYYQSEKILGKLYRNIDEHQFFAQIQAHTAHAHQKASSLVDSVWKYVKDKTALIQWKHHLEFAYNVKENYEENLIDTMLQFSTHRNHFITEIEVFSGSILGKNGAQSKRQRESSVNMKDKHDRDVAYIVKWILQERGEDGAAEALERSIACLYVGCKSVKVWKKVGTLVSFAWVAAAICLKEVEKLPGNYMLL
ncbi:MAG: hypothetical protein Q9217_001131 [Psora testacea]